MTFKIEILYIQIYIIKNKICIRYIDAYKLQLQLLCKTIMHNLTENHYVFDTRMAYN